MTTSNLLKFLFSPFGRASRRSYWIALPPALILRELLGYGADAGLLPPIALLLVIALSWFIFALVTRRLHDFNTDAAPIYLAWTGVGVLALFCTLLLVWTLGVPAELIGRAGAVIALLAQIGFLVWAGSRPGDLRRNRHGRGGSAVHSEHAALSGHLAT